MAVDDPHRLGELAAQLRVDAVRASAAAGSGHPTSSLSAADLIAVLLARHLRYDVHHPGNPGNDHLVFSKGHASPLLYATLKAAGAIGDAELLTFRARHSRLEGHPTPRLPWVDVATGSLGFGLPVGVGLALTGRRLDRLIGADDVVSMALAVAGAARRRAEELVRHWAAWPGRLESLVHRGAMMDVPRT